MEDTVNIIVQKPYLDPEKDISFGGNEEEEMIKKFNSYDILWYAPYDSEEKLEKWKAFTNINVIKVTNEIEFIQKAIEPHLKLLIITTGPFAEATFPKIGEDINLPLIIIFTQNIEYYKNWSTKYKHIINLVLSLPSQIFEFLLKCHEDLFNIPLFEYELNYQKEFIFNYYDYVTKKELLINKNNFSLKLNKYEKFSIHSQRYFQRVLGSLNFKRTFISDCNFLLNVFYSKSMKNILNIKFACEPVLMLEYDVFDVLSFANELASILIKLTIISLYFSKYAFLFYDLSYSEIELILKEKTTLSELRKDYNDLISHLDILIIKIMEEKKSILKESIHLRFVHIFLIKFLKLLIKAMLEIEFDEYIKFPTVVKYLMDIDFCLKLFFYRIYGWFRDPNYKMFCRGAIDEEDKRILNFISYTDQNIVKEKEASKYVSIEDINSINKTLKFKNCIVIGNENFHNKIKNIEKSLVLEKIDYLSSIQIRNYLKERNKNHKTRNFDYFIIIKAEEAENMYKELYLIQNEFCLNLILIIFFEDKNMLINKRSLMTGYFLSSFIAYNTDEIVNYINCQENLNCSHNFLDISSKIMKTLNKLNIVNIPKTLEEKQDITDRLSSEDGWELVDSIPDEIFSRTILFSVGKSMCQDTIRLNIFKLFKEKNLQTIFYNKYCKYFFNSLYPENVKFMNSFIKQFVYAYTLEEEKYNQSFYYIINKDLRSGEFSKIEKYLEIISVMNYALKTKQISCYEGELFRATKIANDFIENKIIVGKSLTNLSFWSATKSEDKAKEFLSQPFRNILFSIKTKKNNIDVDKEKISYFADEEEVLFLPYSKFLIKSKGKIIINNKEVYKVELEGLDNEKEREKINSIEFSKENLQVYLGLSE